MAWIRAIVKWFNPRRRLIAIALVGWVILVIVGAGRAATTENWVNVPDLGGLVALAAGIAAILGVVFLIVIRPGTRRVRVPGQPTSRRLPLLAALVFVLLLIAFAPKQEEREEAPVVTLPPVSTEEALPGSALVDDDNAVAASDVVALLLLALVAAGVVLYTARRGALSDSATANRDEDELATALEAAIETAAERLRVGRDPRAAVITAYAGLEQAVAERGHPRRPPETPTEHMTRALTAFPTLADPVVQLGALYEVARFSDHPIGEHDRAQAMAALEAARTTLAGATDRA